jgi:hypothetical protein
LCKENFAVTLNLYEMIAGAILRYRIILYHLRFKANQSGFGVIRQLGVLDVQAVCRRAGVQAGQGGRR